MPFIVSWTRATAEVSWWRLAFDGPATETSKDLYRVLLNTSVLRFPGMTTIRDRSERVTITAERSEWGLLHAGYDRVLCLGLEIASYLYRWYNWKPAYGCSQVTPRCTLLQGTILMATIFYPKTFWWIMLSELGWETLATLRERFNYWFFTNCCILQLLNTSRVPKYLFGLFWINLPNVTVEFRTSYALRTVTQISSVIPGRGRLQSFLPVQV